MGKVSFEYPVEAIHGKIKKSHKVGFAQMKATGTKFTQCKGPRTTPVKPSETAARQKFAAVSANTRARMNNASTQAADRAAFKAQTRYKTFYGFLFRLEWDSYSA